MAARQPLNQGTTHRTLMARNAKPAPTPAKPAIALARADQSIVVPTHAVRAPDQAPSSETAMNDQSAVAVTGRADTGTQKLRHGFVSA
jgi:hypothetical protein